MVKILSQSGMSLADVYNVQGSIVGIDQLEPGEIQLVHEMGATIFSERFGTAIRRSATAALLQSTAFDLTLVDFSNTVARLLGVTVFAAGPASRVANATVSVRSVGDEREIPIFNFDAAVDDETTVRMQDNGGAVSDFILMRPVASLGNMPTFLHGAEQKFLPGVGEVVFRGTTTAFGAGTVVIRVLLYLAVLTGGSPSNRGLPIPSW